MSGNYNTEVTPNDSSSSYEAFGFLGLIVVLLIVMVTYWISLRLMITYVYLKTGNTIKGSSSGITSSFLNNLK